MMDLPTLIDIREAAERIRPYIHRTPVLTCESIDRMVNAKLFFKCENFQKVGAFKFRGACNAVFSLSEDEARRGVATHSSGNHAAALALAAQKRGIQATIVMPSNSPEIKKAAVAGYEAKIIYCEPTLDARESTLTKVVQETGATFIHPSNDLRVIIGQGTAALELLEEISDLEIVMTPVGGGGLLGGTALAVSGISPWIKIIAAEPEGADDAYQSFRAGKMIRPINPKSVADGLLTSLGDNNFPIIKKYVHQIVTVSEKAIIQAMRHIWERMKIIVEPSAAVTLAALLEKKIDLSGKRVGIILSGGNLGLDHLPWMVPAPL